MRRGGSNDKECRPHGAPSATAPRQCVPRVWAWPWACAIWRRSGDDLATLEQSETAFREDREAEEGSPALMICARPDIWIYSPVLEVCSASRPIRPVGSAKATPVRVYAGTGVDNIVTHGMP